MKLVLPIALFAIGFIVLWLLRVFVLGRIEKWIEKQTLPLDSILYNSLDNFSIVFCLVLSIYLGLLVSQIPGNLRTTIADFLWTFFVVASIFGMLNIIWRFVDLFGKKSSLPGVVAIFTVILVSITLAIGFLFVLAIWGAPTSPILLFITAISMFILWALRDTLPDYAAAFQLAVWDHIKVGDPIKLQEGEHGIIVQMGWYNVEVLKPEGESIIIPNSQFIKQIVTRFNGSPEAVKDSLEFFQKYNSRIKSAVEQAEPRVDIASILSKREIEVAELISQGATNKELAEKLFISEHTVKVHVKNILQKLELKNRQQIAVLTASQPKKLK